MEMRLPRLNLSQALFICLLIIASISTAQETEQQPANVIKLKKIAVMPYFLKSVNLKTLVSYDRQVFLADSLYNELTSKLIGIILFPTEVSRSKIEEIKMQKADLTDGEAVAWIGKYLNADAVLVATIVEYKEREGVAFGTNSPASVAFNVQLLGTESGDIIWQYYFDETQRPLLEDVAQLKKFIKRKGKWVTADELAREGVAEVANKLNNFIVTTLSRN